MDDDDDGWDGCWGVQGNSSMPIEDSVHFNSRGKNLKINKQRNNDGMKMVNSRRIQ